MAPAPEEKPSPPQVNPEVCLMLLQDAVPGETLKVNKKGLLAIAHTVTHFIQSYRSRAEEEATREGLDAIGPEHVEAVMAELFNDY
mmetsp:Transcript_21027/g.67759  ORF Transcript_21027/g.67759 Transcript_21027/m.67759 type:complete len:86 (+) Transcript_21027:142-399(+)|eukprot:CAMPEP_0118907434 /NCGR_PEP_ID=MMETSP1166-20130328/10880_1 /TAXON_ID=1104430 /ORGANISM="Chrysoreinhardia sp, Strain CCMP3193" /LENGTH=85 /DNA_ID=CAMNT_0006846801 /DNA_START=65 /DNA_END=322 /DNA_ORIENTATION=+